MSKFDTCIYAEYFGDYGMNICNHPSRKDNSSIYEGDCRKCKLHMTATKGIDKCPFCGKKAHLSNYCGSWHIECNNCDVEMKHIYLDKLMKNWNRRV